MARPVGEGKYAIVNHNNHTELAFVLELPKELGEAQKELGIEKEASYIITVINPKVPKREEYLPTTEDAPKYPESVLNDFSNDENTSFWYHHIMGVYDLGPPTTDTDLDTSDTDSGNNNDNNDDLESSANNNDTNTEDK